jgi:hypothetical protein
VTGPGRRLGTRKGCCVTFAIDDADLSVVRMRIIADEFFQNLRRGETLRKQPHGQCVVARKRGTEGE